MPNVEAHITGTVWKVECKGGDEVEEGDTLVILESMKMEMPVEAEDDGTVSKIVCEEGQAVSEGDTLVVDTIGINAASFIDDEGSSHSDKEHIVERYGSTRFTMGDGCSGGAEQQHQTDKHPVRAQQAQQALGGTLEVLQLLGRHAAGHHPSRPAHRRWWPTHWRGHAVSPSACPSGPCFAAVQSVMPLPPAR